MRYLIKSMTGFGSGEAQKGSVRISVEVRATNHRYRDIQVRVDNSLMSLEPFIKEKIQRSVSRGRVDAFVNCEKEFSGKIRVNRSLARQIGAAIKKLAGELNQPAVVDVNRLAGFPDVIAVKREKLSTGRVLPVLQNALDRALAGLTASKRAEGERLGQDIAGRIKKIEKFVTDIEKLSKAAKQMKKKANSRKAESESAVFAEKTDVTEEIVRTQSHLHYFGKLMKKGGALGRQFDFTIQEIFREINTIAAKANDYRISQLTLKAREELEKIREQSQNIE